MKEKEPALPEKLLEQEAFSEANLVDGYTKADGYLVPDSPEVRRKLEWFQDQKLGLMVHWGPYAQLGIEESWILSDDDREEERMEVFGIRDRVLSRERYFDLSKTFYPIRFRPEQWAEAVSRAGFRYLIFTTKHHDGFTMWDSKLTDYKITSPDCPYHTAEYADVCRHLFAAMRAKGIAILPYFSKADWHCKDYWNNGYERGTRTFKGPSYVVADHPDMWKRFEDFTRGQILELVNEYGPLDGLWMDAGWVTARRGEDIHMEDLVREIRKTNPDMLFVDRGAGGIAENYSTPEVTVPETPPGIPWESCFPMGTAFAYRFEERYKSLREIVRLLTEVVAKGGNLALNVAPQPDGRIPKEALQRMEELGRWLRVYGEAIYETRMADPYQAGDVYFTKNRKTGAVYAVACFRTQREAESDRLLIPWKNTEEIISLEEIVPSGGRPGYRAVEYRKTDEGILVPGQGPKRAVARVFRLMLRS